MLNPSPATDKFQLQTLAIYSMSAASTSKSITVRRTYVLGDTIFLVKDYPDLRSFYSKLETKDQESIVLTAAPVSAKPAPTGN